MESVWSDKFDSLQNMEPFFYQAAYEWCHISTWQGVLAQHGLWCLGSLCHQDINNHDIDVGLTGPCPPMNKDFNNAHSVLRIDRKYIQFFMLKTNSAPKWLTITTHESRRFHPRLMWNVWRRHSGASGCCGSLGSGRYRAGSSHHWPPGIGSSLQQEQPLSTW